MGTGDMVMGTGDMPTNERGHVHTHARMYANTRTCTLILAHAHTQMAYTHTGGRAGGRAGAHACTCARTYNNECTHLFF